ncbi:hypothetical protein I4U23_007753 [Adineta vaga]|nr:hypothetical protein I4U23_007753 [Adineta vaga]
MINNELMSYHYTIVFVVTCLTEGKEASSQNSDINPKQRAQQRQTLGSNLVDPYYAFNPDYMGGNMPNVQLFQNNINTGRASSCTCSCGDMSFGPPTTCLTAQTCVAYCLQMYPGQCTIVNTYGCCGTSCQYFQTQSLETRVCTCNCAGQQFVNPIDTCVSSQSCLTRCLSNFPQACTATTTQACCGQDCQSYSQAISNACACTCLGNSYYPSPKCTSPEGCISTCMTTYGDCTAGQTQGCCGASCSSFVPTCSCRCGADFTTTTSVPCQSGRTCLETCLNSYGACTQDNTQACLVWIVLIHFLLVLVSISCGSPQQCVQACLQSVAQCNVVNTQGCCGSDCTGYIPTCRCQCGSSIHYTTSVCGTAEQCTNTCISQFGFACTPTNTVGCCNGTMCTRRNRFLGVSKSSTLTLSFLTTISLLSMKIQQQQRIANMKLLTLLCVFLSITTGSWAYSLDCVKGPEYWCRDASTAKDCDAVEHCQQTVWQGKDNSKKTSTTSETAHMLCNVLVHASSELLSGNSINIDSIKEYLRQDCTKLPDQNNLIQQCQMAVDIYLADILRHITSGTELNKICSIIQGHDTSNVAIPKPTFNNLKSNQTCVLCEFIVHILQTFASANTSAQELAHILEGICNEMPSVLRDECKSFVEAYGVDLIALLVREFDPAKVCELLKICAKSQNVAFLTKPNAQMCGLCDYISTYLSANRPIENVCKHFSPENNLKQQCEILARLYKPNFCSQLPLCYDENEIIQPLEQPIESSIQSAQCSLCKYVVSYVDAVVQTNKSEAAIEAALEKVCGILPSAIKAECISFVDTYGPLLAQLIAKYGTPDLVCNALKMCHNGTQTLTSIEHVAMMKLEKSSLGTIPCIICKYVIGYIETATKDNKSAAAVEAALDKVCNLIPGPLKDNCTAFVHKYGPIIAFLFSKNETAQQICDFIKSFSFLVDIKQVFNIKPSSINSAQCSLCKYVVSYVDAVIQTNKSEAAIEAALEKVCGILPPAIKAGCVTFVDTYGPLLAQLIAKYGTPDLVCNALKMCHNGTEEMTFSKATQITKSSINSAQCSLCKYVVSYVDAVIQNNKSEAAIEAALEKVCGILPPAIKTGCVTFVDTYGPLLAQLIAKYGTPDLVCNALKMCHNGTEEMTPLLSGLTQMLKKKQPAVNSLECSLCKYVVGYIDTIIQNNKSEAAIEAALEKVCTILPAALKGKCDQFVVTYGPVLVQLIQKYGTPELVCNALQLCHNGTESVRPTIKNVGRKLKSAVKSKVTSAQCSLCKYVVSYVDAVIQNNKSEAAIEAALEKVCGILPPAIKTGCVTFVDTYGPILAQLIAKYGTPDLNFSLEIIRIFHIAKATQITKSSINSAQCSLCKYVVSYVDAVIQNNKSEAAIEAALEKVCGILPPAIKTGCVTFVDTYGPILAQLIAKYGTPDLVCNALKMCHNGTEEMTFSKATQITKSSINSAQCSLCKYVVSYVDAVIQNNKSEAAIEAALEKVCGILPPAIKTGCVTFVDVYGPILVQLIAKYGTPELVCNALKMCHNGTQASESIPHKIVESIKKVKDGNECTLCKYIISYVDLLIVANTTEHEFEKALEFVCSILPASYHDKCDVFVRTYSPILVELIAELDDPNTVCEFLDLCPKSGKKFIQIPAIKKNKLRTVPCTLCQYVVNYLDAIVQSNTTETKFEEALNKACKVIPEAKLQAECKTLVHLYGGDLIKLLVQYGDPKAVCQALGLCDK